ncbi:hypothetical protein LshimejAT787_1701710 [Lyophyllum shimeji]|uniref:Uncharacterized protein n=1 Tax=Lyophyllum shimeji TaxID=47721 RepID=A0A9P3UR03_LYOSH|nr:hypothetical protein LshimejAT787_1701710 [Lyophyllum shimeji]
MPTRVQTRPAEMSRTPSEKFPDHDASPVNRNIQPKEALSLRLALGSILAPKRSFTPSSHSSSGTASPAHPASYLPPPPPNPTPMPAADGRVDGYLHPRGLHLPHTPSRLGQSEQKEHHWPVGSPPSVSSSASVSPRSTQSSSPTEEFPPLSLPPPVVDSATRPPVCHAPRPLSAPQSGTAPAAPGASRPGSGAQRSKFLETLDSKSAWDALIHGSFS